MFCRNGIRKGLLTLAALLALPLAVASQKEDQNKDKDKNKPAKSAQMCKLRIEVTAGEKNQPVDNASVYVKFNDSHSKRMIEMNLKTNRQGITHSPELQTRKVLIQVIAEGWKTYGRWFDTAEGDQTIQVHLEKPPKWY